MNDLSNKHEHYELLNLLGYGLAKFNNDFIKQFNCRTKEQFYQYFVDFGIKNQECGQKSPRFI